jgi:hypothetical protein
MAWILVSSETTQETPPSAASRPPLIRTQPRTADTTPRQRSLQEDDLKTKCAKHPEAQTDQGWPHSRFDQCFLLTKKEFALTKVSTGQQVAWIKFSSSLLVFAYDGSRRIDYVFNFDEFSLDPGLLGSGQPYLDATTLAVSFGGCGTIVTCSPTPVRSDTALGWNSAPSRTLQFSVTTDDNSGTGKFKIVRSLIDMKITTATAMPDIRPGSLTLAYSRGRFDSALGTLGGGKHRGAIMPDYVPTAVFDRSRNSPYRMEAVHIDDALHRPVRTFPSFPGKSAPGEGDRPLHRLMNKTERTANNTASRAICKDVWDDEYADRGLQCDEYPFQSTYEGSFKSTGGDTSKWHGSARVIDGEHNRIGGNHIQEFYNLNRVLDEHLETDREGTPSDPFKVTIVD